jgi:hypothetical protein
VTGPGGLMLMLLGSVAPAIILTLDEKRQKAVATPQLPSSRRTPDSGRSG